MQNIFIIQLSECTFQLSKYFQRLTFTQFSQFFNVLCECSSVTELIDQIVVIGSPEHLHKFDDIGVVDFWQDGDLIVGEFTQFRGMLELLDIHDLDCVVLMRFAVLCLIDITVLSLSYFFKEDIIFDNFVHLLFVIIKLTSTTKYTERNISTVSGDQLQPT